VVEVLVLRERAELGALCLHFGGLSHLLESFPVMFLYHIVFDTG
jgi:hypothetical protein